MTTIDLGEVTATEFEPPRPPVHAWRRPIRSIALAVVALLTVVTATASARTAAPKGLRPLWNMAMISTDTVYLSGDSVLKNRTTGNRATLTAYDAATGALRWTADSGSSSSYPDLVTASGVLLQPVAVTEFQDGDATIAFTGTTAALDRATGARLWQMNASAVYTTGDTVLMAEHDAQGRVTRLRVVRLRDGGTVWSRALVANSAMAASDDAVVTVDDHGAVAVLRWADGSVLRTGTVPWTPNRLSESVRNDIGIAGGALVVGRQDQEASTSIIYRLDTLTESWRTRGHVDDCDVVLCSLEDDGIAGRDPLTGAERWRLHQVPSAFAIGSGRLLGESADDSDRQYLIDARTGRIITTIGPGDQPWSWGPDPGPLLLVRPVFEPPLHVTVLRIDRSTGEELTLGALDWIGDGNPGCQAAGRYLICPGHERLYVMAVG